MANSIGVKLVNNSNSRTTFTLFRQGDSSSNAPTLRTQIINQTSTEELDANWNYNGSETFTVDDYKVIDSDDLTIRSDRTVRRIYWQDDSFDNISGLSSTPTLTEYLSAITTTFNSKNSGTNLISVGCIASIKLISGSTYRLRMQFKFTYLNNPSDFSFLIKALVITTP